MRPEAKSDDLLYVASGEQISVYTYPGGRLVGNIGGAVGALCSDAAGDVFVVGYEILEYAHGVTQPIATLDDYYNNPHGCAVDPTTGNLAV
ncbi:MAG TPA: hypothetical protein VHS56_14035, partial [Candidatus Cybelea sp.]|nr:hypothetical protein [Candidatus Cybelea sp.]